MSMAFGIQGEKRNVNTEKQSDVSMKEVTVYSGGRVVLCRVGRFNVYSDSNEICVTEENGTVTKIYNAAVIVREKL